MDYNPENNFYGNAPQKPFTEKNDYSQPQQRYVPQQQAFTPQPSNRPFEPPVPPQDFNPEKPLMPREPQQESTPVEIPAAEAPQGEQFNPVQHTAVYQNGAFVNREPQQQSVPAGGFGQPAYPPQNYYRQPAQQNVYAQPVQQNVYAQQEPQNVYAQPKPPKQKPNKGLIAVIIVLSVLLAGSLAGIFVYVLHNGSQKTNVNTDDSVNGFHEFTLPDNNGGFFQQETTVPQVNEQSDYSDKIIPDYNGMKLEKKPSDSDKSGEYGSEYAFNSVSESVVGIMCYSDKDKNQLKSQGSGIIISQGGYLITNAHVINNSKTAYAITVITSDGKEYNAGVVGFDSRTDLAVLKS